jgi:tRNA pseudouridine13 synthase
MPDALPYLTADLPGCGGIIKAHPEDFFVEEIPRYPPSGAGTHLFCVIEKTNMTTMQAVQRFARALGRAPRDIGYAGLKDARGVTRQTLSVEHVAESDVADLDIPNLDIRSIARHGNKLRLGHLAGNRFVIRVRQCADLFEKHIQPIADVLTARGAPNYFGPQRFGRRGLNAEIGAAALEEDYAAAFARLLGGPRPDDEATERAARERYDQGALAECAQAWPSTCRDEAALAAAVMRCGGANARAWRAIDRKLRKLFYSAAQSALFNRVLSERIGELDSLRDGDVAMKHANGACFAVPDAASEQPRCRVFEISPTGPIWGAKMKRATNAVDAHERAVAGARLAALTRGRTGDGVRLEGARRPLRVPPADLSFTFSADAHGPYLELAFRLPPGAFATSVVREFTKSPMIPKNG